MNTKTTFMMALAALVVAGALFVAKPWEETKVEEVKTTAKALFDPAPTDVDKVELIRPKEEPLAFAKSGNDWRLVKPIDAPAVEWRVKSDLVDKITGLKYLKKHEKSDKSRPDEKLTGLDQPRAIVKLFTGEKLLGEVHVGNRLPTGKGSYIQLGGSQDVLESQDDLSTQFRTPLNDFRDKTIVKFDSKTVKRVTVTGTQNFELTKSDDEWVIEKPVRGRADKARADRVVNAMSNLSVQDWKRDNPSTLTPFKLDDPTLKVTVETLVEVPPKAKPGDAAATQPADTQPSMETKIYTLAVGGPTDDTATGYFAKLDSAPWVFSVGEYTYKELSAPLADLREKTVATVDAGKAIKVEAGVGSAKVTLVKSDGNWKFQDGTAADSTAVEDLIRAVNNLKASDFADPKDPLLIIDWTEPQATVSITQEGRLNPVRVLVGPASASGKMVYVRNAAEESVAAVRQEDVASLLASPVAYRDRKILELQRDRIKKLDIRRSGSDPAVLALDNGAWRFTSPIDASADSASVSNLLQHLASLRADKVVGMGQTDKAKFGLDQPSVTLAVHLVSPADESNAKVVGQTTEPAASQPAKGKLTNKDLLDYLKSLPAEKQNPKAREMLEELVAKEAASQPESATKPAMEAAAAEEAIAKLVETQPAAAPPPVETVYRIHLAHKDGNTYACVDGQEPIYQVAANVYHDAAAEMHDRQIAKFEVADVTEVALGAGDSRLVFRKAGEEWKYQADPVLPIDKEKVTQVLNDIRDLKTHRFVAYAASDLSSYHLSGDFGTAASVSLSDGRKIEFHVATSGPAGDPDGSKYAVIAGQNKVFLLKNDQVNKITKKIDDFEKKAASS